MKIEDCRQIQYLRRTLLALSLGTLVACSGANRSPSDDSEVRRTAAESLSVFVDSWNRAAAGDTKAPADYGTLYWPDAEPVDPTGMIWEGQPAIVQMHVDLWNTAFKGSRIKGAVRKTRQLSPTLMIADLDLELAMFAEAPPGSAPSNGVVKTHLKHVMEKRDDTWKVVAAQNTFESEPQPVR
jgi:uncharacterized protein (TIGR02246 family)